MKSSQRRTLGHSHEREIDGEQTDSRGVDIMALIAHVTPHVRYTVLCRRLDSPTVRSAHR